MSKHANIKKWLAAIMIIVGSSALFGDFGLLCGIAFVYLVLFNP